MNNRILELAAEAEDYADSIVDQGGEFHLAYTQKFAELIVQDCVAEVAMMGVTNFENEDISWACRVIIDGIKSKFGV